MKVGKYLSLKKETRPNLGEVLVLSAAAPVLEDEVVKSVFQVGLAGELTLFVSKKTAKQLAKQLEKLTSK